MNHVLLDIWLEIYSLKPNMFCLSLLITIIPLAFFCVGAQCVSENIFYIVFPFLQFLFEFRHKSWISHRKRQFKDGLAGNILLLDSGGLSFPLQSGNVLLLCSEKLSLPLPAGNILLLGRGGLSLPLPVGFI